MDLHREPVVVLMPSTAFTRARGNLPSVDGDWKVPASGPRFLVTPWAWISWLALVVIALFALGCSPGIASPDGPPASCRPEAKNAKGGTDLAPPAWTGGGSTLPAVPCASGTTTPPPRGAQEGGTSLPWPTAARDLDILDAQFARAREAVAFHRGAQATDRLARLHRREGGRR
jgi:hypothetical protein